jgi:hypothetical protein
MAFWRMAFRDGNKGQPMWDRCWPCRVAAITYDPIANTDLTNVRRDEAYGSWNQLASAQKASLSRVAYEMKAGDVIYVKEGPTIIGRGTITGRYGSRAYTFDHAHRIIDFHGVPWNHQVPVEWSGDFPSVRMAVGRNQRFTVEPITEAEARKIESAVRSATRADEQSHRAALVENKYYRLSPAQRKLIIPRHNRLSNSFRRWLREKHSVLAIQERNQVDIRFDINSRKALAELEVSISCGTRRSIREAVGQVLEYNHYPGREAAQDWLVVLDERPSKDDLLYVRCLRDQYSLPIFLGWRLPQGFEFDPMWPA